MIAAMKLYVFFLSVWLRANGIQDDSMRIRQVRRSSQLEIDALGTVLNLKPKDENAMVDVPMFNSDEEDPLRNPTFFRRSESPDTTVNMKAKYENAVVEEAVKKSGVQGLVVRRAPTIGAESTESIYGESLLDVTQTLSRPKSLRCTGASCTFENSSAPVVSFRERGEVAVTAAEGSGTKYDHESPRAFSQEVHKGWFATSEPAPPKSSPSQNIKSDWWKAWKSLKPAPAPTTPATACEEGHEYGGTAAAKGEVAASAYTECPSLCRADDTCKFWTYVRASGKCHLIRAYAAKLFNAQGSNNDNGYWAGGRDDCHVATPSKGTPKHHSDPEKHDVKVTAANVEADKQPLKSALAEIRAVQDKAGPEKQSQEVWWPNLHQKTAQVRPAELSEKSVDTTDGSVDLADDMSNEEWLRTHEKNVLVLVDGGLDVTWLGASGKKMTFPALDATSYLRTRNGDFIEVFDGENLVNVLKVDVKDGKIQSAT